VWCGVLVWASVSPSRARGSTPGRSTKNDSGQVVTCSHTCASAIKQHFGNRLYDISDCYTDRFPVCLLVDDRVWTGSGGPCAELCLRTSSWSDSEEHSLTLDQCHLALRFFASSVNHTHSLLQMLLLLLHITTTTITTTVYSRILFTPPIFCAQ